MNVLSDRTIKACLRGGRIGIDPLDENDIQPASVDLRLSAKFLLPRWGKVIDPQEDTTVHYDPFIVQHDEWVIKAHEFFLGATFERIRLPSDVRGRVEGKSSLARLGLVVHVTGGFIDPGFEGPITLEMCNLSENHIILRPGMKICQLELTRLTTPADRPYGSPGLGSKYTNNEDGPTPSLSHMKGS